MSGSLSMWGREQILDAFFRPDVFVAIPMVEVALCQALPSYTASTTELIEPSAEEYHRMEVELTSDYWEPTGFGELTNRQEVSFPEVGLDGWGLLLAYAVIDPVSGQCIHVGQIANPIEPLRGMAPRFEPGMLAVGIYDDGDSI